MVHGVRKKIFFPFNESQELQISKQLKPLNALGCDYFYYVVSDGNPSKQSYRFCTHEDWVDHYHEEKFIDHDPLKRIIEQDNISMISWNLASQMDKNEKRTMDGRADFGLYNGLSLMCQFNNNKHIMVLASESREHDLARYLLLEKKIELGGVVRGCVSLLDKIGSL